MFLFLNICIIDWLKRNAEQTIDISLNSYIADRIPFILFLISISQVKISSVSLPRSQFGLY